MESLGIVAIKWSAKPSRISWAKRTLLQQCYAGMILHQTRSKRHKCSSKIFLFIYFYFFTVVSEVYIIITDFAISSLPLFGNKPKKIQLRSPDGFLLGGTHRLDKKLNYMSGEMETGRL